MLKLLRIFVFGGVIGSAAVLCAQSSRSCPVDRTLPGDADKAMMRLDLQQAEQAYAAAVKQKPADATAVAGLIRVELAEERLDDALALARKELAEHPKDAVILTALGDVALRRGEPELAFADFAQALQLDPCGARSHFDYARYLSLGGMAATARKQLELAHALAPNDLAIERAYHEATSIPPTPEQMIAELRAHAEAADATPEQKAGAEETIKAIQSRQRGDCQPVNPVEATTVEMQMISNGPAYPVYAAGLDVYMNGKRKRLEIDTGASGLLISRSSAISAGLIPETEIKARGIGDRGAASAYVTHVDHLRIGDMEFRNCMVRVLEKRGALEVDGLIGADVFRNYLVTLDFPSLKMKLDPLPKRPGDDQKPASLATTGERGDEAPGAARAAPQDRYIAPEMKNWTKVYRVGHDLIFPTYLVLPTGIGPGPPKLFIMDTGAATPLISSQAAREVTHVSDNDRMHIRGINGEVKNVLQADNITIQFAGVRQKMPGVTSIDTSAISRDVGLEIGGFIGFPTLAELIITIDYRDDLVHVVYDPKHGMHSH